MKKLLFIVLMSVSVSVFAESNSYSTAYKQCINEAGGAKANKLDCDQEEYKKQDARLNANYKKIMDLLNGKVKQHLLDSQRLWVKYRDATCDIYMYPEITDEFRYELAVMQCYLSEAKGRADYLEDLIKAVE